jgi:hypothetical protein
MALLVADRVQETTTTTGTGDITLAGAVTGYQAFSSVLATSDSTYYTIADQSGSNWEVGLGTFTSPSTLARTTILSSSNSGSVVTFGAGTKNVFITYPASRSTLTNSSNVVPVPTGGTGVATLTANNVILGNGTSPVQFVAPGTSGNVLTSNGTTWASSTPGSGTAAYARTAFTATAAQTTFSVTYVVGAIQVYVNGALLNAADYTASNGTSVVLATGCLVGDIVEFITVSGGTLSLATISVGTTAISSGTSQRIIYNNAGVVGEIAPGSNGNVLTSNGSVWSSSSPWPLNGYQRNKIINGGMAVDQRNSGASQSISNVGGFTNYCVDRWYVITTGGSVTGQRVAGSGINQYRYQITGGSGVTAVNFGQRIESINCYDFNGGTAYLSVDLANTLFTTVTWSVYYANTTDSFGTATIPTRTLIATGTFTVSSTVANYGTSISIPAAATTGIEVVFSVGAQTSGTYTIGNVQLEAGNFPTPFERLSYGQTLMLCQRYLQSVISTNTTWQGQVGQCSSTTGAIVGFPFQAVARIPPTGITVTNATNFSLTTASGVRIAVTAISFLGASSYGAACSVSSTGLVAGNATTFFTSTLPAQILFTGSEL